LPLSTSLSYAAQIARELRDLHARGGAHGHIATSAIVLDAAGASLAQSLHYTDGAFASRDVHGWGAMLQELVGAGEDMPGERKGPEAVLPAARRLARKCIARSAEGQLTMQQAFNEVRMLAMLAKQYRLDQEPARSGSLRLSSFGQPEEKPVADPAPAECGPCPKCAGSSIYVSRPDSFMERKLTSWGIQLCRCHSCYHRWLAMGGVRIGKRLSHGAHGKLIEPRT
jgi:hypothetical protein